MYSIRCRTTDIVHDVGRDRVISAHRTSEGTIAYVRCPCGEILVVDHECALR